MSLTHLYRNEGANLTESSKFLPINWVWTTIGEIVHVIRGIAFPKDVRSYKEEDGYVACLRTANVQQEVEWDDLWLVPARYVKRQDQIILPFDILISNANSLNLVGKVALVKYIPYKASLGAFISLMRVKEGINPRFVYFLTSSSDIQTKIRNLASTTTNISNISTSKLVTVPIPLPPLPEQERIVARIESLFTRLDAGVAGLKRAQAALKRYKASVLKAACEGRLVPQDPNDVPAEALLQRILAENPARGGSRPASTDGELPALPEGWCWANVHWIALKMQYGTSEKADKDETGIIVLRMGNIQDGELNFGNVKYLPTNTIGLEQLVLEPGDLLFNRTNSAELVGKTAVYRELPTCNICVVSNTGNYPP